MKEITEITRVIFDYLQLRLQTLGLDSDRKSFKEIRYTLNNDIIFTPEEFAYECFYVICVAGFKQDYAKIMSEKIIEYTKNGQEFTFENLIKIYKNKMKVKAIVDVWENRVKYQKQFYNLNNVDEKVNFLQTLPHIGNITKYHLARNLGLNFVKYDIWIQRLGVALCGTEEYSDKVNNSKLLPEIKYFCDNMFKNLAEITGESVGFLDVVLWRACQKNLLVINKMRVFLDVDKK